MATRTFHAGSTNSRTLLEETTAEDSQVGTDDSAKVIAETMVPDARTVVSDAYRDTLRDICVEPVAEAVPAPDEPESFDDALDLHAFVWSRDNRR